MAEAKETKEAKTVKAKESKPKVVAVYGEFVDLIKDVKIGSEPVEVEIHPWLQSQIDAGKLKLVE